MTSPGTVRKIRHQLQLIVGAAEKLESETRPAHLHEIRLETLGAVREIADLLSEISVTRVSDWKQ